VSDNSLEFDEALTEAQAAERALAAAEARLLRALARIAELSLDRNGIAPFDEFTSCHIAPALNWTDKTATNLLHLAVQLTRRLPGTFAALERGDIDIRRARALAEVTEPLSVEQCGLVETRVLPKAVSQTAPELRQSARRQVLKIDPEGARRRHEQRKRGRQVRVKAEEDGMANLGVYCTATDAETAFAHIDGLAHACHTEIDRRTLDQRRADVAIDLLTGRIHACGTPTDTLAEDDDQTGRNDLNDSGAAADSSWTDATNSTSHTGTNHHNTSTNHHNTGTNHHNTGKPDSDSNTNTNDSSKTIDPDRANGGSNTNNSSKTNNGDSNTNDGSRANKGGSTDDRGWTTGHSETTASRASRGHRSDHDGCSRGSRRTRGSERSQVHVTMPLTTLIGLDDLPGELAGYGPIPAQLAREFAADATLRRLVTDPLSGTVLDVGTAKYRPPARLAEFVRARDRHCRFPGCRRPGRQCDLDHGIRFPDGPTSYANLCCLCRRHHRLKTEGGWLVKLDPDGMATWISPTGRVYITTPEPLLEVESEPPPPTGPIPAVSGRPASGDP
jgi:hypothetical protein